MISPNGTILKVVASGPGAADVRSIHIAFDPDAVTVGLSGKLFVANSSRKLLIEFSDGGRVLHSWQIYVSQAGLATAPARSDLVADYREFALDDLVPQPINNSGRIPEEFALRNKGRIQAIGYSSK